MVVLSYIKRLFTESTLVHFPVGLLAGLLTMVSPVMGVVLSFGFLFYEAIEDWRIKDRGYRDVFGFLIGYSVIGVLVIIFEII